MVRSRSTCTGESPEGHEENSKMCIPGRFLSVRMSSTYCSLTTYLCPSPLSLFSLLCPSTGWQKETLQQQRCMSIYEGFYKMANSLQWVRLCEALWGTVKVTGILFLTDLKLWEKNTFKNVQVLHSQSILNSPEDCTFKSEHAQVSWIP